MSHWNRNKCLMLGLLLALLGLEFRLVDRFVLNQQTSETLAQYHRSAQKPPQGATAVFQKMSSAVPVPRQVIQVPAWLGMALISVGVVLVLQSLVMPPAGGGGGG